MDLKTHINFVEIYIRICATLRHLYCDVNILEYGSNENELFLKFKLSVNIKKEILLNIIWENFPYVSQNLNIERSEIEMVELIQLLKNKNDNYYINLYEKFLMFGNHFTNERVQKDLIRDLYDNKIYKYDEYYYRNIEHLIKSIHFASWNVDRILSIDHPQKYENYFTEIHSYLTFLFINLDALIKNLQLNLIYKSALENILEHIKIKEYHRYKNNKLILINTVDGLINHFRDAVCHFEEKNNKIIDLPNGGYWMLFIHNKNIQFGDGFINWNTQLLKLISQLTNLLIGKKSFLIVTEKINNKHLFSLLLAESWNLFFPLIKLEYRIEKENNEMNYAMYFKKIA